MRNSSCWYKKRPTLKKLHLIITVLSLLSFPAPGHAETVPDDIKAKCAKDWGSDYKMQLFCRQEQMKALKLLQDQDRPSVADKTNFINTPIWSAYSTTAIKITGDIKFTGDTLLFKNGAKSKIRLLETKDNSRLYELKAPAKSLLNGNTLCSDDDDKLYMLTTIRVDTFSTDDVLLEIAIFDVEQISEIDADKVCASYSYTPAQDQANFSVDEDIDQKIHNAGIVDFCMAELGIQNPKSKKVLTCVKAQTEAIQYLQQTGDFSECASYSTGFRMLGSMEYVDKVPVANCKKRSKPSAHFAKCVKQVTGKIFREGFIEWEYEASEKIANCFNN